MTDAMEKQFLADIIEHPDEDVPRLIYADWLDDHADGLGNKEKQKPFNDKAEFIRAQVVLASGLELDGGVLTDERRQYFAARERELLGQYQDAWEEPLRALGATGVEFSRGLPDGITISASDFLSHGKVLFAKAPIREAWLVGVTAEQITPLANSPHMEKLTHLSLGFNRIGNNGARLLANSPHLKNLTHLNLFGNVIGDEGVEALASSPHLKNLTHLNLFGNVIHDEGVEALANSPNLKNLVQLSLGLNSIGNNGALSLANSPYLKNLTHLNLFGNVIHDEGAQELVNLPHLKNLTCLDLGGNNIGDYAMQEINRTMDHRRAGARQR